MTIYRCKKKCDFLVEMSVLGHWNLDCVVAGLNHGRDNLKKVLRQNFSVHPEFDTQYKTARDIVSILVFERLTGFRTV